MNNKKDILFLCQYFYPEYISSATLPYDTAKRLSEEGFSVDVITGYPKEYTSEESIPENEVINDIWISRLNYKQMDRSSFVGRLINYFSFTISVFKKFGRLRNYKVIVVYSNPPVLPIIPALAKKLFGVDVVFVSYDIYPEIAQKTGVLSENSVLSKIMNLLNKFIFKNLTSVVALSNEMKSFLLQNRSQLQSEQIEVIPNWHEDNNKEDRRFLYEDSSYFKTLKQSNKLIVSYFGNLGTAQDIETLMNTMLKVKAEDNIHFLFAGHGNKLEKLKEFVHQHDITNIDIYSYLHGQEFSEALDASDCFIVTLDEKLNGLAVPSKTYSYLMAGKPVIAIMSENCDIVTDLTDYNAGLHVKNGDSESLRKQLINLGEKGRVENMGRNARKLFKEKHTKDISTQKYVDLITKIRGDMKNV
ncbi:glycosyltransferase family 4 protein [Salinicoccus halitifaciens]|uniref:Glycosyltransferase involved in cell wall biosynthesis n=1 Tax=Salinicoccus halitifaciens TaxID=1073415 RepID=A0ABV2EE37_9STAP|nr:glycosyltransferase family 4 protein [Salinicoccus halitifaciens]MCD2138779.1 glycosyltransferase family 4 protein [Salinicoccus halitifaciens]